MMLDQGWVIAVKPENVIGVDVPCEGVSSKVGTGWLRSLFHKQLSVIGKVRRSSRHGSGGFVN